MKTIEQFFHEISPKILQLAKNSRKKTSIINQKVDTEHSVDFATETDVAVEKLITQAGGIITDLEGQPRTLASHNGAAARDPKLHATLLELLR